MMKTMKIEQLIDEELNYHAIKCYFIVSRFEVNIGSIKRQLSYRLRQDKESTTLHATNKPYAIFLYNPYRAFR